MIMGLGDLGDAQTDAYATVRDITRAFNAKSFTAAEAIPIVEKAQGAIAYNASRFMKIRVMNAFRVPTSLGSDLTRDTSQVSYLLGLLRSKAGDPYRFRNPDKLWKDVKDIVLRPVMWQSDAAAITNALDAAAQAYWRDLLLNVTRLPAAVAAPVLAVAAETVRQTLETGLKPLLPNVEIPSWVVPALGLGAAGILALKLSQALRGR